MVAGEKRTESGPDWDWPDVGPEYLWPLDLTDCSCGTKDEHQGEGWTQTLWTVTSVSCADSTKTENRIADIEVCRSSNVTHWFCWRTWNKILNCSHVSHTHVMTFYLKKTCSEYLESHTDGKGTAFSTITQVTERRMTHHCIHCRILFLSSTWEEERIKNHEDIQ